MSVETVSDFLKRGGKIKKVKITSSKNKKSKRKKAEPPWGDVAKPRARYVALCNSARCTNRWSRDPVKILETKIRQEIPHKCPKCMKADLVHETHFDSRFVEFSQQFEVQSIDRRF